MLTCANDNEQNAIPFKGPFKGKGANRRAMRELEQELTVIRQEMDLLIGTFKATFSSRPRVVNMGLVQRKNTYPLMWWRASVNGGPFIQLFNSERGQLILANLGPNTVRTLREFDYQRLHLNFRSKVVGSALESFVIFENGIDKLELVGA